MKISKMIKSIEARRAAIGKERDKLRDMIMELEALEWSCTDAMDNLDRAIDALSENA